MNINELQALDDEALDARWNEIQAHNNAAHTTCMENGGYNGIAHHHSDYTEIREACINSTVASNVIFYEYQRRGVKTPSQREFETEVDQMFA